MPQKALRESLLVMVTATIQETRGYIDAIARYQTTINYPFYGDIIWQYKWYNQMISDGKIWETSSTIWPGFAMLCPPGIWDDRILAHILKADEHEQKNTPIFWCENYRMLGFWSEKPHVDDSKSLKIPLSSRKLFLGCQEKSDWKSQTWSWLWTKVFSRGSARYARNHWGPGHQLCLSFSVCSHWSSTMAIFQWP